MKRPPSYIRLHETGELNHIIAQLGQSMQSCNLCPHNCRVNRLEGERGRCNSGAKPIVASYSPHFGEEAPLVGLHGSGTIFFSHCNLSCVFCQNYDISQFGHGTEVSYHQLAGMMMELQRRGCHNINFVSPTHMIYPIIKSLALAVEKGLNIPLVYNTGGYDALRTVRVPVSYTHLRAHET